MAETEPKTPEVLADLGTTPAAGRTIMALSGSLFEVQSRIPIRVLTMRLDELKSLQTWLEGASKLASEVLALPEVPDSRESLQREIQEGIRRQMQPGGLLFSRPRFI